MIETVYEEKLLGTGGTLLSQIDRLVGDDLLVAHADNLTLFDLDEFLARHQNRPSGCVGTMMTFETDSPKTCGIVELDDHGVVQGFYEKAVNPPGNLANAAVFLFSPAALSIIRGFRSREGVEISADFVPHLMGQLFSYHNNTYHRDIGSPCALAAAEREFPSIYEEYKKWKKKKFHNSAV